MKLLKTSDRVYGPFTEILVKDDHYLCDGGKYPFIVVGNAESVDYVEAIPSPPITTTPHSVSPRQIRQALTRVGLRPMVESVIASGDQDLKDWYEFSTEFLRDNEHVIAMGVSLGVTDERMDALWRLANSL
jgi:hypothetical protein